jgi:hypothetical protein
MYRCEFCEVNVPPQTPARRIVVETRVVEHPYRKNAIPTVINGRHKWVDDPGGRGTQIIKEKLACPECAAARANLSPSVPKPPKLPRPIHRARPDLDLDPDSARERDIVSAERW